MGPLNVKICTIHVRRKNKFHQFILRNNMLQIKHLQLLHNWLRQ